MRKYVVSLTANPLHGETLKRVAAEFGWAVVSPGGAGALHTLDPSRTSVILFDRESGPASLGSSWLDAISTLRKISPEAFLIACCRFSDAVDYPSFCRHGVFHLLQLPVREDELRQSLGFAWAAERQRERLHQVISTRAASSAA